MKRREFKAFFRDELYASRNTPIQTVKFTVSKYELKVYLLRFVLQRGKSLKALLRGKLYVSRNTGKLHQLIPRFKFTGPKYELKVYFLRFVLGKEKSSKALR